MNIWHDIPADRVKPESFSAVIEISKGSKNKYELDKETGMLRLDRVLYTSTHFPANYGFIPRTYSDDNDPLDVLVLCSESIVPMTIVECCPIGVMRMQDMGASDEKIIAVCKNDPYYNHYENITNLPKHIFNELRHFYTVYKMLEDKEIIVEEICDSQEAIKVIRECMLNYKNKFILKNNK